ncbi:G5 domain-containing protein [Occultella aeris]|uniref:G5 domain protein n=1 Tax=Occultella aeris TaxID=2761496 RepID=A0A7M4DI26_9MICO|nr:G5 domain-containing protein [Occultella aeris]VZO36590.1 G5 domain protein [Occultella aeris]
MSVEKTGSRHRADSPATTEIPRPLRRLIGVGGLVVVLAGSLAFATTQADDLDPQSIVGDAGAAPDVTGRDNVWAQVSRGELPRTALEAENEVTFTVTVDGQDLEITSNALTLADALIDNGIVVGVDDQVSSEMNRQATDGDTVTIARVGTQYGAETEAIPFETVERETSALPAGTTRVDTEGVEGSQVTAFTATYENGVEVSRTNSAVILVSEPVDEVVLIGTGATTTAAAPEDSGSSSSSTAPSGSYSGSDPRGIAQQMVTARGWDSSQWSCLDLLWQRESNWNPYAQNPSSGAYGIPQSLPGSKMASAGSDWQTNPATQITWGLNYIAGRYGTPCGAWGHSQSVGWY